MRIEELPTRETLGGHGERWDAPELENVKEVHADLAGGWQGLAGLLELLEAVPPNTPLTAGGLKSLLQPSADQVQQALASVQAMLPPE